MLLEKIDVDILSKVRDLKRTSTFFKHRTFHCKKNVLQEVTYCTIIPNLRAETSVKVNISTITKNLHKSIS